jgi:large subunit ribosomal protein L18
MKMKMKLKPTYRMPFKRRREGKTDYSRRLKLLKSGKPRLVVRKTLNYIRAQIIGFEMIGDKTMVAADSKELKKHGWNFACDNLPAAYLTGMLIGKKAAGRGIEMAILDGGLVKSTKGSKIYAAVKGARDAGLNIPIDEEMLPDENRVKGMHIAGHVEKFKNMPTEFEKIKQKIAAAAIGQSEQKIEKKEAKIKKKGNEK